MEPAPDRLGQWWRCVNSTLSIASRTPGVELCWDGERCREAWWWSLSVSLTPVDIMLERMLSPGL